MRFYFLLAAIGLSLAGCQSAQRAAAPPVQALDQQWHPSTLSAATIAHAEAAISDYRQCLNQATQARLQQRGDPRDLTNTILKTCEDKLPAIKTAFDAEQVPGPVSERKIQQTRSQGLQSVLRTLSAVQAMRAADEAEAQAAVNTPKTKKPKGSH